MSQLAPQRQLPPLVATILGPFRLCVGERLVPDDAWTRRAARDLLLLLLATPGHTIARDRALDLLWPEVDPDVASNALYKALHVLRRVLEPDLASGEKSAYVRVSAGTVGFLSGMRLIVDADEFEERLAAAGALPAASRRPSLREALALYRGDLLVGEPVLDWTVARREGLRRAWRRAALELADLELTAGDPAAALSSLETLLAADASDERALYLIMGSLAELGRRDEAMRWYEAGRVALRDGLGLEPDGATRELAARLRASTRCETGLRPVAVTPLSPRRWEELPAAPSPLVGRARELERILDLIWRPDVRLVTLTGPGGVGKTRLALEVAAALIDDLAQGACFVDLAPVRDPDLVLSTVARALGLSEEPGKMPLPALRDSLRGAELLLVLDNCEQVLDAAPAVAELLASCPRLKVLATSREPLHLRAEHLQPVPPLGLPPARSGRVRPADLARYEAPALFLHRARAVAPNAAFGDTEAEAIVDICARLDGLPLAIELAAARSHELPPATLLSRLNPSLPELTRGYRDLPARQRTLHDAIAWSYDLLTPDEQVLFRRLAVFVSGCDLAAVEAVAWQDGKDRKPITPQSRGSSRAGDLVAALAAKSLLRWESEAEDRAPRVRMLETIREFALERLGESGEEGAVRDAHLDYAIAFAEEARRHRDDARQGESLDRLEDLHGDLRAALEWALTSDPTRGLYLATLMGWFWKRRGHYREAVSLLERTLDATSHLQTAERTRALNTAGWMAEILGNNEQAEHLHLEALELARALGNPEAIWTALNNLGTVARVKGNVERAVVLHEEAVNVARAEGDDLAIDVCLTNFSNALLARGDIDGAADQLAESLAICRNIGDPVRTAETLINLGTVAMWRGDMASAIAQYEEGLAAFRAADYEWGVALTLSNLGEALVRTGQLKRGIAALHESLHRHRELGDERSAAIAMINLSEAAVLQGAWVSALPLLTEALQRLHNAGDRAVAAEALEQAARYLVDLGEAEAALSVAASAETVRRETGAARQAANDSLHDDAMTKARSAIDPVLVDRAWKAGLALRFDEAIAEAITRLNFVASGRPLPRIA